MPAKRINLCFVVLLGILFSCNEADSKYDKLESIIRLPEFNSVLSDATSLFIIPNGGCEGCITTAEAFVMEHLESHKNLKVVFTGTKSQKSLRLKVGETVYNHPRVIIDNENKFYSFELMSMYPQIVYLNAQEITDVKEVSPQNPLAIEKLLEYLTLNEQYN